MVDYRKQYEPKDLEPFFPHDVLRMVAVVYLLMALLLGLALLVPIGPEEPADPYNTPAHIKPEWYFLATYQLLKLVPNKILGIGLIGVIGLVILLLPFIDRVQERDFRKRPLFTAIVTLSVIAAVALSIWGKLS